MLLENPPFPAAFLEPVFLQRLINVIQVIGKMWIKRTTGKLIRIMFWVRASHMILFFLRLFCVLQILCRRI